MAFKHLCPTIDIRQRLTLFQYPADNWPNIHILTSTLQIVRFDNLSWRHEWFDTRKSKLARLWYCLMTYGTGNSRSLKLWRVWTPRPPLATPLCMCMYIYIYIYILLGLKKMLFRVNELDWRLLIVCKNLKPLTCTTSVHTLMLLNESTLVILCLLGSLCFDDAGSFLILKTSFRSKNLWRRKVCQKKLIRPPSKYWPL